MDIKNVINNSMIVLFAVTIISLPIYLQKSQIKQSDNKNIKIVRFYNNGVETKTFTTTSDITYHKTFIIFIDTNGVKHYLHGNVEIEEY